MSGPHKVLFFIDKLDDMNIILEKTGTSTLPWGTLRISLYPKYSSFSFESNKNVFEFPNIEMSLGIIQTLKDTVL